MDFGIKVKEISKIICDFRTIGDGVNIILYNLKDNFKYDYESIISLEIINRKESILLEKLNEKYGVRFPIWIENTTNESIDVELFNNRADSKNLPEGIKCNIYDDNNAYETLLGKFESNKYQSLFLYKIYSGDSLRAVSCVMKQYIFDSKEYISLGDFHAHPYFSALQFQSNIVRINNGIMILDLTKDVDSGEIKNKQKLVLSIPANSKIAYICSLS